MPHHVFGYIAVEQKMIRAPNLFQPRTNVGDLFFFADCGILLIGERV